MQRFPSGLQCFMGFCDIASVPQSDFLGSKSIVFRDKFQGLLETLQIRLSFSNSVFVLADFSFFSLNSF